MEEALHESKNLRETQCIIKREENIFPCTNLSLLCTIITQIFISREKPNVDCACTHIYTHAVPSNIDAWHNSVNIKEDRFKRPHTTWVHSYEVLQSIRRTRKRRDSCVLGMEKQWAMGQRWSMGTECLCTLMMPKIMATIAQVCAYGQRTPLCKLNGVWAISRAVKIILEFPRDWHKE